MVLGRYFMAGYLDPYIGEGIWTIHPPLKVIESSRASAFQLPSGYGATFYSLISRVDHIPGSS